MLLIDQKEIRLQTDHEETLSLRNRRTASDFLARYLRSAMVPSLGCRQVTPTIRAPAGQILHDPLWHDDGSEKQLLPGHLFATVCLGPQKCQPE